MRIIAASQNVSMPASKLKASVAQVLQEEGYIEGFSVDDDVKPTMTLTLKYFEGKAVIEEITRLASQAAPVQGSSDCLKFVVAWALP